MLPDKVGAMARLGDAGAAPCCERAARGAVGESANNRAACGLLAPDILLVTTTLATIEKQFLKRKGAPARTLRTKNSPTFPTSSPHLPPATLATYFCLKLPKVYHGCTMSLVVGPLPWGMSVMDSCCARASSLLIWGWSENPVCGLCE